MAIDLTAAEQAARNAEEALAAAERAKDAAEVSFLDTVKSVKQIQEGRTAHEANRLKSRYISVFGYAAWTKLVANSR